MTFIVTPPPPLWPAALRSLQGRHDVGLLQGRQLALAHAPQRRVDRGEFVDHADLARALGFTRARVSQLMNLLLLAPDIQEEILFLETPPGTPGPTEHSLRHVLAALDWDEQGRRWMSESVPRPRLGRMNEVD